MSNNEELLFEYELLRQEIAGIDMQIKELQEHHNALLLTRESIEELKKQKNAELFVPSGAGVYFNAQLKDNTSCLVNVGANVIVEIEGLPLKDALQTFEKRYIYNVLESVYGSRTKAAEILGIHRNTLLRKLS